MELFAQEQSKHIGHSPPKRSKRTTTALKRVMYRGSLCCYATHTHSRTAHTHSLISAMTLLSRRTRAAAGCAPPSPANGLAAATRLAPALSPTPTLRPVLLLLTPASAFW